jgi:hypothetical protein
MTATFNRANRSVLWSSKVNNTTNNILALLLDTGNTILSDASNTTAIFWQSFDHMMDISLTGVKSAQVGMLGPPMATCGARGGHCGWI